MSEATQILVVGAGIGGLVLTRALLRLGLSVVLVEREEVPQATGAGITLGANAMRALRGLGLGERLEERGRAISAGALLDARGRVLSAGDLSQIEARYGKTYAMDRRDLHAILRAELEQTDQGAELSECSGTSVRTIEEQETCVRVELDDGRRFSVGAVIGADGIYSRVRELVFGVIEPVYSGYTCYRFTGHVRGGLSRTVEMWGHGQRVGLVPLPGDRVYAFLVENSARGSFRDRSLRSVSEVRRRFSGFGGDVPRVLEALDEGRDALLHHDIEEIRMRSWVRGRVALLGDAAHAMSPNLGQGAGMAIEDAVVLARELSAQGDVSAALLAYESRRRPRVSEIQTRSRRLGIVGQWSSPFAVWLRNQAMRSAPARAAERTIEGLVAPNVEPLFMQVEASN